MTVQIFEWFAWTLGALISIGVLLIVAVQAAASLARLRGGRKQQQLELELLRRELDAEHRRFQRLVPLEHAWEGYRKFEVERVERECQNVTSLYLAPHDNRPLAPFYPGQFLTFAFRVPGRERRVVRCYSLSDRPQDDHYRITVKKIGPPRGQPEVPPGLSSSYVNDCVSQGDILDVKAPSGEFYLDMTRDDPVVLIAGGIGLTPLLSMLLAVTESGSNRETWFFLGVTNRSDHVMKAHLEALAAAHENVHLLVCYAKPLPEDVHGKDYQVEGFLSLDILRKNLPSNNYDFYLCGPPPMMSSLTEALDKWGVPEERVHFEAFGPATVKRVVETPATDAVPIEFSRSGRSEKWTGDHGSLLEFGESLGVPLSSGCRSGNCGECETAIKSGKVQYVRTPSYKPERGSCLTCICVPDGPLTLDA